MQAHDQTPTQPQTSKRVQRKSKSRLEFRSSCDSCSSSKVRCTKEQPHCSRCVHNGLKCIYGRSLRRGKPPSSKPLTQVPFSFPLSQPSLSQPTTTRANLPLNKNTNYNYACPWSRSPMFPTNNSAIPNIEELPDELEGIDSNEVQACQATSEVTDREDLGLLYGTEQDCQDDYNNESETLNEEEEESYMENDGLAAPEKQDEPCVVVACNTLSSLSQYVPPGCGNGPPGQQTSESHLAFLMIRSATEKMNRLLDCKCVPCSHDPSILMVINAVLFKILTWYEFIYQADIQSHINVPDFSQNDKNFSLPRDFESNSSRYSPTSYSPNQSSRSGDSIPDSSYRIPLKFDSLNLPQMTERRLKAQLMLCELQPLNQACRLLHRRAQAIEDPTGNENIRHGSRSVLQQRTRDLQKNLSEICTKSTVV
ncbi:transcriptional regulator family: Fungal Specific TF [Penicillium malachiteum]|uniref:transcriptional regulator family: Fungal Specific TF n=1 Tax=Penicillium malachiteum TaxID=1324776 RepID=UPI0025469F14|nr:transcriptional regulator family: Fungal Specific TF [Penicillium malachiteum]KAJ5729665.1 transcriptional regulator family: Fungal Specific TF [Penicillium malachiteum]